MHPVAVAGALALTPALIAAAVLPRIQCGVGRPSQEPRVLQFDAATAFAEFLVPCPGCLGAQEGDEAFVLELQAFASEAECGVSNVTLNGRTLTQEWYATHANGQGLLSSFVGSQEYALDLSWETSCLLAGHSAQDTAQLLNVNIDRVNGVAVDTPSGFRLSYKQLPRAELLRLSTVKETSVEAPVFAEDWRRCRWFGGSGIGGGDYEEKRALILAQEGVLEAAMQAEIRALREAALRGGAGVGELATAEEGRMPRTFVANTILHGSPNPNLSMYQSGIGVGVGQPLSRTSSLPSYATEAPSLQPDFNTSTPPPYTANPHHHHHHHHLRPPLSSPFSHADDAAEADSDIVTDGFRQYAPTSSADADADADIDDLDVPWTPESSIPDLSPRQSGETDRTVVSAWERV